jgi:GDSL-like Lipase/Acylhydrolase family
MRTLKWSALAIFLAIAVSILIMKNINHPEVRGPIVAHVVLIGASIGQGWHLAEWPARVHADVFTAESIPAWQFDKSEVLDELLMRPARKFHLARSYLKSLFQHPPRKADIVILKECSSYFPGDLSVYERRMQDWVSRVQAHGITVVLATVAPVTHARAEKDPGKQESLLKYNEWVRLYAAQHGLKVLDLEAALRNEEAGRYLRDEFATADGSHLNAAAYALLDDVLQKVVGVHVLTLTTVR